MKDTLIVTDEDWNIQTVNEATLALLGYQGDELKAKSVLDLLGNDGKLVKPSGTSVALSSIVRLGKTQHSIRKPRDDSATSRWTQHTGADLRLGDEGQSGRNAGHRLRGARHHTAKGGRRGAPGRHGSRRAGEPGEELLPRPI